MSSAGSNAIVSAGGYKDLGTTRFTFVGVLPVMNFSRIFQALSFLAIATLVRADEPPVSARKVIIDQDTLGPASTNLQSVAMLLNAKGVDVLGICVVTGDNWRDVEVRHALRLLEIMGRTNVPVVPGAVFPLVNTAASNEVWEKLYGKLVYKGAWDLARPGKFADPYGAPDLEEGNPTTLPSPESAALFIIRSVHQFPGQVTLWCGGPLTDIALACRLDPALPQLAREIILMGGSFQPETDAREFKHSPRRSFNLRFDPEAAHIVLTAPWRKLTLSPVDVAPSLKSTAADFATIAAAGTPLGTYLGKYAQRDRPMRDEVTAATWIDPTLVTRSEEFYVDVNITHDAGYGDTLSWAEDFRPGLGEQKATVQRAIDEPRFKALFLSLLSQN